MEVQQIGCLQVYIKLSHVISSKQRLARYANRAIDLKVALCEKLSSAARDVDRQADAVIIIEFKLRFIPPCLDLCRGKRFIDQPGKGAFQVEICNQRFV